MVTSIGPMARPTIPLQWTKSDPDGKERFEKAVAKAGGTSVSVARALCDEWARIVLAREPGDIAQAARNVLKQKK